LTCRRLHVACRRMRAGTFLHACALRNEMPACTPTYSIPACDSMKQCRKSAHGCACRLTVQCA
jgi:hypothetical protein